MSIEIIAEVAQGYEGDQTLAKMLARGSMRAGADAVKFQTWRTELLMTKKAKLAKYQKRQ